MWVFKWSAQDVSQLHLLQLGNRAHFLSGLFKRDNFPFLGWRNILGLHSLNAGFKVIFKIAVTDLKKLWAIFSLFTPSLYRSRSFVAGPKKNSHWKIWQPSFGRSPAHLYCPWQSATQQLTVTASCHRMSSLFLAGNVATISDVLGNVYPFVVSFRFSFSLPPMHCNVAKISDKHLTVSGWQCCQTIWWAYISPSYILKADVLDVRTPQKIQIFRRKIVWERWKLSVSVPES